VFIVSCIVNDYRSTTDAKQQETSFNQLNSISHNEFIFDTGDSVVYFFSPIILLCDSRKYFMRKKEVNLECT
jgi:hypothetical protein